jgi:hypothetical protein
MRKAYDSDVSREQFNQISRDLEFLKKKTRPREVDLYDVSSLLMTPSYSAAKFRRCSLVFVWRFSSLVVALPVLTAPPVYCFCW